MAAGASIRTIEGLPCATGLRVAIVVSKYHDFVTDRLQTGALAALAASGVAEANIIVVRVPGAFEIPAISRSLASTGKYHAIICIGCLLRGDTAHYEVIVNEVTRGIGQSAQETGVPHAFGVLTCDTLEQAIDRAGLKMGNKGFEAALAAVEMASLKAAIGSPASAGKKNQARNGSRAARKKPLQRRSR
jgi:6,7-dimethyl-8-ribityllumazine synthase